MAGSQVLCLTANTVGSGSHFHPEQVAEPPSSSFLSQATNPGGSQRSPWWGVGVMGASERLGITGKTGSVHCSVGFVFYSHIFSLIFSSPLFVAGLFRWLFHVFISLVSYFQLLWVLTL